MGIRGRGGQSHGTFQGRTLVGHCSVKTSSGCKDLEEVLR